MTGSPKRSALLSALIHGFVIVVILVLTNVNHSPLNLLTAARDVPVYLPSAPRTALSGGGGGQRSNTPASKGALPKPAPRVFVAPTVDIRITEPALPMAPTILASDNKIPVFDLRQLGDPAGVAGPPSSGPGKNNGIGAGSDNGVGDNHGPSYGPGAGPGISGIGVVSGPGVTHPVKLSGGEPEYTEEARKVKLQGVVVLQIIVDSDGRPRNITVVKSLGLGLDDRAIETVRTWRFKPGTSGGRPVPTMAVIEVNFRLL